MTSRVLWVTVAASAAAMPAYAATYLTLSQAQRAIFPDIKLRESPLKLSSDQRKAIEKARAKLFVFVTRRDVPATNNVSERHLRPSVIFRKVTNGFRSTWGAKTYADLCSIVSTGRRNATSPLAAIRAALA